SLSALFGPHAGSRSPGITYYVSPAGNDAARGTTPRSAWRTLARASAAVLRPGDRLLLQGRQRFSGQLTISRADGGSATRPLVMGSYGTGRGTITSSSNGILVDDATGVKISGLRIVGNRAMKPAYAGIQLYSDRGGYRSGHIAITGVNVSGFGTGI